MALTIVVADDHEIVRIGLKTLFEDSGFQIVASVSNGEDAFKAAKKHRPDVVLLDVRMPSGGGLQCLARIKLELPELAVLMMSGYENPTNIARAVAIGAAGYISKAARATEIVHAVRAAARGEVIWSKETLRSVSGALAVPARGTAVDIPLTQRESEVLKQLALGLTNKEIARSLGISYETVKEHVQHILRKLGVSDRTQAAVWAVRHDLI
jgi:DNA-binding NarL/FixJ family response regulator